MAFQFAAWPSEFRHITQRFGENPQVYGRFDLPGHEGIDVRAPQGTGIFAVAGGVVRGVYTALDHPYGLHVRIDHGDGYQTVYAHLSRIDVVPGERVCAGQQIGQAGSTGNSTAAHLHLTLKRVHERTPGYPPGVIDPYPFLEPLLGGVADAVD